MNLAQSLGVAAAALVVGLSASGLEPAQTMARIAVEARAHLQPAVIRGGVEEIAVMLEQRYAHRERSPTVAYDGDDDPQHLAAQLSDELNSIHRDAHLRVTLSDQSEPERRASRAPPGNKDSTIARTARVK